LLDKQNSGNDCAIIITVHNHIERFGIPCVSSVLKHSNGARVFLYDNESTDPKIDALKELSNKHPEIDYIRIDDQTAFGGLTGTWNDGIRRAREECLRKVVLLNHDVVVDETWSSFIDAIECGHALYGPMSNLPGGGDGDSNPQKAITPSFNGLLEVDRLIGFCLGFTLENLELKLFDGWRFFNPEQPFGDNEFGIQKQMKRRSAETRFYVVTDTWVFHHLNMGWMKNPRYVDAYDAKQPETEALFSSGKTTQMVFNQLRTSWKENPEYSNQKQVNEMSVVQHNVSGSETFGYIASSKENNIAHTLRREILPLAKADLGKFANSTLYIIEDDIDKNLANQRWREFILSKIFSEVAYAKSADIDGKEQFSWLNPEYSYNHLDFIEYSPDSDFIRLSDLLRERTHAKSNKSKETEYVLLSQRPKGNRYLIDSETGFPLEEFLEEALGKRGIPFKVCDFSVNTPAQQAIVCGGAKIFISAHGAGISNMIFTPKDCQILEYNFRKYWNCHPVCDAHFHGNIPDHQKCAGESKEYPIFHKADYHNLSQLLDRPYTELEPSRYEGFNNRNPISRCYLFVDGASLLKTIESRY